jgi:hypothetical protein
MLRRRHLNRDQKEKREMIHGKMGAGLGASQAQGIARAKALGWVQTMQRLRCVEWSR